MIRWIDTAVMIADPLTKEMDATMLNEALYTNVWNFAQTKEMQKDKSRRATNRQNLKKTKNIIQPEEIAKQNDIEEKSAPTTLADYIEERTERLEKTVNQSAFNANKNAGDADA